jgi:hypothetical protein
MDRGNEKDRAREKGTDPVLVPVKRNVVKRKQAPGVNQTNIIN